MPVINCIRDRHILFVPAIIAGLITLDQQHRGTPGSNAYRTRYGRPHVECAIRADAGASTSQSGRNGASLALDRTPAWAGLLCWSYSQDFRFLSSRSLAPSAKLAGFPMTRFMTATRS